MPPPCVVCGGSEGRKWTAREMMLGLRERFEYFECRTCGCLQIETVPAGLQRFYSSGYYSFTPTPTPAGFRGKLRLVRNRTVLTGKGKLGAILTRCTRYPYQAVGFWFSRNPKGVSARILDVGCGAGTLINDLAEVGYARPLGLDPFVPTPVHYPSGAHVLRAELDEIEGEFDLILLNHVLEHVPDPVSTLTAVRRLLADSGECLVRTPVAGSYAWEHYGTDWVQLDAPRHLVIHTVQSMKLAAERAGLEVAEVIFDSDELQFVGSERYRQDIAGIPAPSTGAARVIRSYRRKARLLNEQGRGDQAAFILRPAKKVG